MRDVVTSACVGWGYKCEGVVTSACVGWGYKCEGCGYKCMCRGVATSVRVWLQVNVLGGATSVRGAVTSACVGVWLQV